jgi:hypothetical protein
MVMAFPQVKLELATCLPSTDSGLWCKAIASWLGLASRDGKLMFYCCIQAFWVICAGWQVKRED